MKKQAKESDKLGVYGDPVHGKVLMTIENSQQKEVYIIEKEDGTVAYMGINCERVTNYKKL